MPCARFNSATDLQAALLRTACPSAGRQLASAGPLSPLPGRPCHSDGISRPRRAPRGSKKYSPLADRAGSGSRAGQLCDPLRDGCQLNWLDKGNADTLAAYPADVPHERRNALEIQLNLFAQADG